MEKYSLDIIDNHIIANIKGKRVLIDTGAPISIGDSQEIIILGQTYSLEKKLLDLDTRQISELAKIDINVILGMDILSKFVFYVSPGIKGMICSDYFINFTDKMQDIQINFSGTIPVIEASVDGVEMKMVLDTGSKLSYINPGFLEGKKNIGVKEDYYPGMGDFSTEVFSVPLDLKGNKMEIHFGKPPEWLQNNLYVIRCNGILGADIFRYFNIQFNFKNNRIWLVEKAQTVENRKK